jgi:hypothetical protein
MESGLQQERSLGKLARHKERVHLPMRAINKHNSVKIIIAAITRSKQLQQSQLSQHTITTTVLGAHKDDGAATSKRFVWPISAKLI